MSYIEWPEALNRQASASWHLEGSSLSSGVGLDGREQVVFRENRRWTGEISLAPLVGSQAAIAKNIIQRLRGRAGILEIPVHNGYSQYKSGSVVVSYADQAAGFMHFSDGTSFSDGTGFELPDLAAPRTLAPVAVGATSVSIDPGLAADLQRGVYFSYLGFLYMVEEVSSGTITFGPPARSTIPLDSTLRFEDPTIRVRLASDSTGKITDLPGGYSVLDGSLSFVEAFDR